MCSSVINYLLQLMGIDHLLNQYIMETKTGVWIDGTKAHIVTLNGKEKQHKTLLSDIETRVREPGEGRKEGLYGDEYIRKERQHDNRHDHEVKEFAETVTKELGGSGPIVVFGPAQMKLELAKAIKEDRQLAERLIAVETADKMTDNQVVAWVADYFENR